MSVKPEIVPYCASMKDSVMRLMGNQQIKAPLWDWQFEANPFCERFDPVVACMEDRVVGFNGVMPVCLSVNRELMQALWSCDFYVDQSVRGKGLGRLIKEALHEKCERIMALGVSDQAAPVLERMGWQPLPCMLILHHVRGIHHWRDAVFRTMQVTNRLIVFSRPLSARVIWSPTLPENRTLAELWQKMRDSWQGVQIARTPEYMRWKYASHPAACYEHALLQSSGEAMGLMVCRLEGPRLHVVDYVGKHDEGVKAALLRDLLYQFSQHRHILLSTSDTQFERAARSLGFYKGRYATRFYVFQRDQAGDALTWQNWFLMGGDSDGELLVAAHARYKNKELYV